MTEQTVETERKRYLPLAPWRVRVWQEPDGTWSARYRRASPGSADSWGVTGCTCRKEARQALTGFVRREPRDGEASA